MTTRRPRGSARSRAEARRRARYEARGIAEGETETDEIVDERSRPVGGGFLSSLFPPAPPLTGQPDPLADFHYDGPLRPVVASLYLLVRHPLPWLIGALLWMTGQFFMGGSSITSFAASLLAFGGLIGAGWFAPWRPWLAGLAAGVFGWLAFLGFVLFIGASASPVGTAASPSPGVSAAASGSAAAAPSASVAASPSPASPAPSPAASPEPAQPTAGTIAASITFQIVMQGIYGGIGGFYGGYLRRRMAAAPGRQQGGTSRRR